MGLLRDAFHRASRAAVRALATPVPERFLSTVDHAIAAAEHTAVEASRATVKLAEAATASWRPSPPTTTVTQILPTTTVTWSVTDVDNALATHEQGQFIDSAMLMDAMGRDDRIKGCLDTRVRALAGKSGIGFSLKPSEKGDRKRAEDFAKEVHDVWYHACPENVMTHILRDAVMMGIAVARIHWELVEGKRVPRLEPWDLRGVFWDWSIRRFRAIALEGVFTIDPYSAEWLIFEPAGYRSWMNGAIRALGRPWVVRKMTFRDWARYSEKHGMPMLAIREPTGNQWERQKQGFWAKMKALGAETTLRLPTDGQGNGFDVKLIEATARSEQSFELLIKRLDTNVAVALLGQNLSTEVQGGSYAAAQAHNLIRLDYLDADAQTLSTALREQVWKAYLRFNYPDALEEETPFPTWETRPPEDKKARAEVIKAFASLVSEQTDPGVRKMAPLDLDALADELSIPLIADFEEEAQTAAKPQIYKYHYDFGLITKNEGRDSIGLPPVPDGDQVPLPVAQAAEGAAAGELTALSAASEAQKAKARHAVEGLIKAGKLPHPNDVECADCGHKGSDKPHHYDHHRGYGDDVLTDVRPMCVDCHRLKDGQDDPEGEAAIAKARETVAKAKREAGRGKPTKASAFATAYEAACLAADADAGHAATALAVDPDALDAAYAAWRAAVNMTAAELEAWADNPASRLASVDHAAVIERNLRLLRKPKSEWDERDVRDAKRTASFVARMREMPRGKPARKGLPSRRDISLRNWAHDPSK